MIIGAVLAVARDPDRITWDDPAAWLGAEITGPPNWRVQGTGDAVAITVALRAGSEIIDAWPAEEPDAGCNPGPPTPPSWVSRHARKHSRQHESAQA